MWALSRGRINTTLPVHLTDVCSPLPFLALCFLTVDILPRDDGTRRPSLDVDTVILNSTFSRKVRNKSLTSINYWVFDILSKSIVFNLLEVNNVISSKICIPKSRKGKIENMCLKIENFNIL